MRPVGRRLGRIGLFLVVLPATCGAALALLLMLLVSGTHFDFSLTRHVKPIPVSKHACPYLNAVRTTGGAAGDTMTTLLRGVDFEGSPPQSISVVASPVVLQKYRRLPDQLAAFDFALRVSVKTVPHPIGVKLARAAREVEQGRVALVGQPDAGKYFASILNQLMSGVNALSDASALVGRQCGFTLSTYSLL